MKNLVYGILAGAKRSAVAWSAVLMVTACVALAAPEPAIVQGPDDWTLDVKFEHPQQIMLQSGGDNQQKRYWYMIITLTNKTKHDIDFYPKCELVTDTFEVTPAGKDTPPEVFERIKKLYHRKFPFLELLENSGTKILQGEDNTRDIAVIWSDFDAKAKNIDVFIAGLSNETVAVDSPTEKDQSGKPVKIYLRKTLELSYKIGGDPAFRSKAKLVYQDKHWVMR